MVETKGGGSGGKGGKGSSPSASKSYLARVLLHDNVSQQQLLDMKLSQIAIQQKRVIRMWDNHKKTFVYKQFQKQQQFRESAVDADIVRLVSPAIQKEHGLTLPPIEEPQEAPELTPPQEELAPAEPVLLTEAPGISDSLLSLEEKPKTTAIDGVEPSAEVLAVAKKATKAVELPPIKKRHTFYDEDIVNDQRFANLFESLTGNFFTDAYGRHPLIA